MSPTQKEKQAKVDTRQTDVGQTPPGSGCTLAALAEPQGPLLRSQWANGPQVQQLCQVDLNAASSTSQKWMNVTV